MSVTQDEFDAIEVEYAAAQAEYQVAKDRYDAAGRALVSAQCGEFVGTLPSAKPGHIRRIVCTLVDGHDGEHVNKAIVAKGEQLTVL